MSAGPSPQPTGPPEMSMICPATHAAAGAAKYSAAMAKSWGSPIFCLAMSFATFGGSSFVKLIAVMAVSIDVPDEALEPLRLVPVGYGSFSLHDRGSIQADGAAIHIRVLRPEKAQQWANSSIWPVRLGASTILTSDSTTLGSSELHHRAYQTVRGRSHLREYPGAQSRELPAY